MAALTMTIADGTGIPVTEDVWSREVTDDGRVYYYNRATGSSQWHLPNVLYESMRGAGAKAAEAKATEDGGKLGLVYPTHAKAMLRVDCVTEELRHPDRARAAPMPIALNQVLALLEAGSVEDLVQQVFALLPELLAQYLQSSAFQGTCADVWHMAFSSNEGSFSYADASNALPALRGRAFEVAALPALQLDASAACHVVKEQLWRFLSGSELDQNMESDQFVIFASMAIAVELLEQS
eukprot:CAMPEP_0178406492 /NCGR_PEP_ID=MMETSP0689_2-20121128/18939_1 /TAXON_ID=160604 /ORGANISM="Amphidinium massartii, Strain CS-259" /LENGTH=237 /DNA_ID=CAMNT_0020027533 /DNA_START=69 /DNA_END=782 /DNA_ORIENTATION=-